MYHSRVRVVWMRHFQSSYLEPRVHALSGVVQIWKQV